MNNQSERTTSVLQKWGICTKFEHWNSNEHLCYVEHLYFDFPTFAKHRPLCATLKTIVMLTIRPTDEIVNDLFSNRQSIRNFPKIVIFPFDKLYSDLTTQIRTTEISSECILFDSVEAFNETKEFSDTDYWAENYANDEIAKFWIFGQNGQGDLWIFDSESKVYFYDHNKEQMCKDNFIELNLNFGKWLQFADLNKQLDNIYDIDNEINEKRKAEYKEKLNELSNNLLTKYPFDI